MPSLERKIVITDIGSTTTKAILLENAAGVPKLLAINSHPTTVESPHNDVRYGVKHAILGLEKITGAKLLDDKTASPELLFREDISYLSTSSAGGGLQILVIGLTLFDSASSAKRAAYGAGGIILDTFAIDDKRQASQQMLAMRNLHPDMILLCGGTDGGAISGVLRLAEIMRVAKPQPKYETSAKIPTLYAGNQEAIPMIKHMVSNDFDLYILPNLRPSMEMENLQPTQARIQELFMENVMERAPGYSSLKRKMSSPILPTPVGVLKSLAIIAAQDERNVFAFDIGGATTDVFSQINGHFQRTVSANLGMSYSALNVMKECGIENVMRWLPSQLDEDLVRDYVANKCLKPTRLPAGDDEILIEQALAREALRIALAQHRDMHFNGQKIGYLDSIVANDVDGFDRKFNYQHYEQQYDFHESDIDLIVAAGGIFAHNPDPLVSAMIVIDAIRPKGITEIAVDRDFTSPHLGVLSASDPAMAQSLLLGNCLLKLAWHVAPVYPRGHKKGSLTVLLSKDGHEERLEVENESLQVLPAGQKTMRFETSGKAYLSLKNVPQELSTDLPVIIDTRTELSSPAKTSSARPQLSKPQEQPLDNMHAAAMSSPSERTREILLPYKGEIKVSPGDIVQPDQVVAVNRFNPPRLFIVDRHSNYEGLSQEQIQSSFLVKVGDELDFDQIFAEVPDNPEWPRYLRNSRRIASPVSGRVEYIDSSTGLMVLSETQNYSVKPISVNLAEKLGVPAKRVARYLDKKVGDFVFRGDPLASRKDQSPEGPIFRFVKAPATGTIISIDKESAVLILKYQAQPMEFRSHVRGKVVDITDGQSLTLSYMASRLDGILGVGKDCSGLLSWLDDPAAKLSMETKGRIVACAFAPSAEDLRFFSTAGIAGLICFSMREKVLRDFMGNDLGVINTGNEALPFSILILNDFSSQPMPSTMQSSLKAIAGAHCYLAPHTRIRAGVVRPFADFIQGGQ